MKKLVVAMLTVICMFFISSNSFGFNYDDVAIGDTVKMTAYLHVDPAYDGGNMVMNDNTTTDTWKTYCVDRYHDIRQNSSYVVTGMSDVVHRYSTAVGEYTGILSYETAWLYYNARNDTLSSYTGTTQNQMDLQRLIWYIGGESKPSDPFTTQMQTWYDEALAADWHDYHGVKVLHLGNCVQETLVVTETVPIPGAIWLLGSGFLGIVGIFRKRRG